MHLLGLYDHHRLIIKRGSGGGVGFYVVEDGVEEILGGQIAGAVYEEGQTLVAVLLAELVAVVGDAVGGEDYYVAGTEGDGYLFVVTGGEET